MEEKVEYVLKIIDEDGESFARRAEMYYRRRPELLNFVEDFFRSYRALAERFDHLSKDLQTANRTIATVYPERVQLAMEDEDGEQFLASLGPPKKSSEPSKTLPVAPKLSFPKIPSFAKRNGKPSRLMSKKGLIKFNVDDAITAARPSSGLKKHEALQEIDKLQKDILALQTEKEFIKSSYENGLARYWEIEEKVTEMQSKVSNLQDEFGIGTMIEDDEARSLMTATALNSCQETLDRLQEKQKQSVEDVIAEHQKILEVLGKFETLKGKFVSNLQHPQVLSEVNKSSNPDSGLKKHNPEKVHSEVKEVEANSDTFMSDLAEKVDELVDKVINLESALSSQNAYVTRLRAETNELHSHLTKAEEEKGTLVEDSESMTKRIRQLEEELLRVQNLNESIKLKVNQCSFDDLSEQLHNKRQDEDVKDTFPSNKVIGLSGVDKAKQFQAHEAITPGENVLGTSKGVSTKGSLKKEVLREHEGCHEVDQQNLVASHLSNDSLHGQISFESHLSNDALHGQTGGILEAKQGVSGVNKDKQFQVHEAIIPGTNVLGISKGASTKGSLKKEVLREHEGCLEVDQQNFVESHSNEDTRDGKTGGALEANQGVSGVNKAKQFQVHEAIVPETDVPGVSKGVSSNEGLKKELLQEQEDCLEVDQQNFVEGHSSNYTRDGKTGCALEANQGVSGVDKAKQFQVHEAIVPGTNVLGISKGASSKEGLKKEVLREHEHSPEVDQQNLVEIHTRNDTRDGQTGGTLEANQGVSGVDKANQFQVHEVIIPGENVLGISKGVCSKEGLKKEVLQEQEGCLEVDQQNLVESQSHNDTRDGKTGGDLETNQGVSGVDKGKQFHVHEAILPGSDVVGISRGVSSKEDPKKELLQEQEGHLEVDQQNLVESHFSNDTRDGQMTTDTTPHLVASEGVHVKGQLQTDLIAYQDLSGKAEYTTHVDSNLSNTYNSFFSEDSAANQKNYYKGTEYVKSPGYDAMIKKKIRTGEEAKKQDILDKVIPFEGKEEKFPKSDLQNDQGNFIKSALEDAADVGTEKGFDKSQRGHVTAHGSAIRKDDGKVELMGENDSANRSDFPSSAAVNQKKDSKGSECIRSPGYDAVISSEIRMGGAEKRSTYDLQNDHDDLTKIGPVKDAGDVKIEKGFDKSHQVHVTDHGSPTRKNVEQRDANDLADRRDVLPSSVKDKEEKLYITNHQNHLNDFLQEAPPRDSPDVNMERGTSNDDLATNRYVTKEEQARTEDAADKRDYLYIVEGKEEKLYKAHHPNHTMDYSQNSLLRDSAEVKMEMRFDESDLHVSDNESAIRRDMRMEEQAGTKVIAEKSDRLHIPAEGKEENPQKSNHPNYQCDLPANVPIKDATNVKMEKAFHESECTHISDDSSAIREERTEEVAVKDAPHVSRSMSSSYDSVISKDVRVEQQASRIDFADKFASSASEEERSFSNQERYFDDLLQVSPSGATLDGTSERGSNEVVNTMNPPPRDSIFLENTEIQLEKLEYEHSNSQNNPKNIQVKGQGTPQKSTTEKSDQSEDIRASSNGSGISIPLNNKGNGEDSRRQVFRTVHNGLYREQDESGTEDDQPNWRELFLNCLDDDREKILLEEYTSVLRNFKGVKMKLNDAEKKRRASHFQYVVQMKVLKNANALKDAQILSLQHRLNSLQSKDVETTNFNEIPREAALPAAEVQSRHHEEKALPEFLDKSLTHSTAPEDTRISDIEEDGGDIKVTDVDETHSFTTVEEKVRMDMDDLLEENIELWLRFSTSFHQLHKFQTSIQDLQAEMNKVKEECKQDTGQPQSLLSAIRPIYRHLREIQTELTLWLDHNAVLKDDLQNRLSSLSNILDVITRLSRSGSKENDPVLNAYQAAKFQGEILNMKRENNKLAGELEVGFECIRKLQDEIRSTLSNLDEELGLKNQPTRPRSRIPLRSFLFGVKLKNKRSSIFSCVNPALQKQYSDL
ncbi:hypothetical protein RND71_027834 [Anisodus tanguticus]|uniref:NAB domain-containing protein n=1 Tax=Anisodus tanguticus TaxID=243964 RepID=A0AAE1V6J5_9SOLA|nr:hypothetical protein RND71_027834 [Anisodus tanguticus]